MKCISYVKLLNAVAKFKNIQLKTCQNKKKQD